MVPCTENQQEALVICLPAMEQLETLCIHFFFHLPPNGWSRGHVTPMLFIERNIYRKKADDTIMMGLNGTL